MKPAILSIFLITAILATAQGDEIQPITSFACGEKLSYDLKWNGFGVGEMEVRVNPMTDLNGEPVWNFKMNVKTNGFADKIFKVRLDIESVAAQDLSCSHKYTADKIQGRRKGKELLEFDWNKQQVRRVKNNIEDRGWSDLEAKSVDPLTMFYFLRNCKIDDTTKELSVWVADGKRNTHSKAAVVKKETLKIHGKTYETYLIEPELKDLRGVFAKSKNAKLQIWLSADEYHIPVKITSKVIVGSFTARLQKHKKPSEG